MGLLKIIFKKQRTEVAPLLLASYGVCASIAIISELVLSMNLFNGICMKEGLATTLTANLSSFTLWSLIHLALLILIMAFTLIFFVISNELGLIVPPITKVIFYSNIHRKSFLITFIIGSSVILFVHYILGALELYLKLIIFVALGILMNIEASFSLVTQYLLLELTIPILKGSEPNIEQHVIPSLLLGYSLSYLMVLSTLTLLRKTYLKVRGELKLLYQLFLVSILMLLMSTFFITSDLAVAIYLGITLLYVLIIVIVSSALSLSISNPLYFGTMGMNLMIPFFLIMTGSLSTFISKTALKMSLSRCLFPSFMLLSLSTLPGVLSECLANGKSVKSSEVTYLAKGVLFVAFISLVTSPLFMLSLRVEPSQYSLPITLPTSLGSITVRADLAMMGVVITTLLTLLRLYSSKFIMFTFFTNPLTIPAAIILLKSGDAVFLLALASLMKFVFTVIAYRYKEFKFMYIYFKNYIVPFLSGALLITSILSLIK